MHILKGMPAHIQTRSQQSHISVTHLCVISFFYHHLLFIPNYIPIVVRYRQVWVCNFIQKVLVFCRLLLLELLLLVILLFINIIFFFSLYQAVDAIDNGINRYDTDQPPRYVNNTHLSSRVGKLNLDWMDPDQSSEKENEAFERAMNLTGSEFLDVRFSRITDFA